jgi:hypothetical protein
VSAIQHFVDAGKQCVFSGNLYAALLVSITLPDICAALEASDGKTSPAKYVSWFNRYMASRYQMIIGLDSEPMVFLNGNDFYALRCALLHEGASEIQNQRARTVLDDFCFTSVRGIHCNYSGNAYRQVLQLDVVTFCTDILSGAEEWIKVNSRIFETQRRIDAMLDIQMGPIIAF